MAARSRILSRSTVPTVSLRQIKLVGGFGLFIAVLGVAIGNAHQDQGRQEQAVSHARELLAAATDWKAAHGELGCPTVTRLKQDRQLENDALSADPWGGRFRIICSGNGIQVRSAGADGEFQTGDDISLDVAPNS
jgi:hypothetical protein